MAVDGQLCRSELRELREWLLLSADIHEKRVDGLLELLDDNEVDTVKDLARWATMACFDACLKPVTAGKIRDALASWERNSCAASPMRDPSAAAPAAGAAGDAGSAGAAGDACKACKAVLQSLSVPPTRTTRS